MPEKQSDGGEMGDGGDRRMMTVAEILKPTFDELADREDVEIEITSQLAIFADGTTAPTGRRVIRIEIPATDEMEAELAAMSVERGGVRSIRLGGGAGSPINVYVYPELDGEKVAENQVKVR